MTSPYRHGWLVAYLKRYRGQVALALALGLAASSCAALLMFTSGYLISATSLAETTLFSVMVPVACVQLFGFGRPLARYVERLASHNWVLRATSDLRVRLFAAADRRAGDPALARAAGEYLELLSDDVAHLQNLFLRVVFPTMIAYALAVATSLVFGFFSVGFGLVMLIALFGVCFLLPLATLLVTRALVQEAKDLQAMHQVLLVDDVRGATDWILSGRSSEAVSRLARADQETRRISAKMRFRRRLLSTTSMLCLGVLLCIAIIWSDAQFASASGTRDACWIAAFALGFFPLLESFSALPAAFSDTAEHRLFTERLDEFMDIDETAGAVKQGRHTENPENAVEVRDVTYRYPQSSSAALNGISASFAQNQSVAVLGKSGSGKSTLASIISGDLVPETGEVRVSGTICRLGQDPYLFNRTLRENLTLGTRDATDDELVSALENVGLSAKFDTLPQGLNTIIGETGVGFSGGEAHRVALARILVSGAQVAILDEPFSAVDPTTERALLDTLFDVFRDRTLVVITHHLAQIERFDRVMFIEGGSMALDGSPEELLDESDLFRQLVELDRSKL